MGTLHDEFTSAAPIRSFRVKSYLAFYRETPQGIYVLRVLHGRRVYCFSFLISGAIQDETHDAAVAGSAGLSRRTGNGGSGASRIPRTLGISSNASITIQISSSNAPTPIATSR